MFLYLVLVLHCCCSFRWIYIYMYKKWNNTLYDWLVACFVAQAYFIFRKLNLTKPSISIVKTEVLFFRKTAIHAFAIALIVVWKKAFGKEHIMTKTSVIKKLEKLVNSYYTSLQCVSPFKAQIKFKANWKEIIKTA